MDAMTKGDATEQQDWSNWNNWCQYLTIEQHKTLMIQAVSQALGEERRKIREAF
jgi:hypothetical protein